MPRGVDPVQTKSVNQNDHASLRGIAPAPDPAVVFGPGPLGRGISPTPSEPGGVLPRAMPKLKVPAKDQTKTQELTMPNMPPLKKAQPQPKVKHTAPAQPPARKLTLPKRDPRARRSR